jgi:purine-nucleoside phosphorylase
MMTLEEMRSHGPTVGLVLGSGLSAVAEQLGLLGSVPFAEVPGLTSSTVAGHKGMLSLAKIHDKAVLVAQGRIHLYEGHTAAAATEMMAIMHYLGARTVVLTNAAGCIHQDFRVGELMLISDHLNLTGTSPLLGGPHFVDMTKTYALRPRSLLRLAAAELGIPLHEGVYAGLLGPQYETPAEIRMLRAMGADAVGMSTVLEAIRARSLGMKVIGISTLTNWAAGLGHGGLDHHEVLSVGRDASGALTALLRAVLPQL